MQSAPIHEQFIDQGGCEMHEEEEVEPGQFPRRSSQIGTESPRESFIKRCVGAAGDSGHEPSPNIGQIEPQVLAQLTRAELV